MIDTYTSTGAKFFAHQEAMNNLRNGKGQPITTHVMLTDVCNHKCAFCSVQARQGDSLNFNDVMSYLDILVEYDLKSVILSGGGNPILYKCKTTGKDFNDIVDNISLKGLQIGLITNGMPLKKYEGNWDLSFKTFTFRESWRTVRPETLDKITWIRISMSGLDHPEQEVYVPDVDPNKTTLGFSYVAHDEYKEPEDPHHGKVSRPLDIISGSKTRLPDVYFEDRMEELTKQIKIYIKGYKPRYVRLLPNCLEPELIHSRCKILEGMAREINFAVNREVVFVQYKPPVAPKVCYLGYIHPVLNCDGYVYPCDSVVLNEEAGHKFDSPWRICHWRDIAQTYEKRVKSLIDNPATRCPGCVFHQSNNLLAKVVDGDINMLPPSPLPEHINFV